MNYFDRFREVYLSRRKAFAQIGGLQSYLWTVALPPGVWDKMTDDEQEAHMARRHEAEEMLQALHMWIVTTNQDLTLWNSLPRWQRKVCVIRSRERADP